MNSRSVWLPFEPGSSHSFFLMLSQEVLLATITPDLLIKDLNLQYIWISVKLLWLYNKVVQRASRAAHLIQLISWLKTNTN